LDEKAELKAMQKLAAGETDLEPVEEDDLENTTPFPLKTAVIGWCFGELT
jgi:hypothetical protein